MTIRAHDPFRAGDYRANALVIEDLAAEVRAEVEAGGRPPTKAVRAKLTRHWRWMMQRCDEYGEDGR